MKKTISIFTALGLAATSATSHAGDFSATLALDANSHFISYGLDIWQAGDEPDLLFNPSLSIDYALNDKVTLNAGIWLDANNEVGNGFSVQETDIWLGIAYDLGFGSISATWQNWQYAGDSEEILDIALSFDTFLNPTILFHQRLGAGASGGEEGLFIVGSISHDFELSDKLTLGLSSSVGFGASDFHTVTVTPAVEGTAILPNGEEVVFDATPAVTENNTGFGYASFGASLSYAVSDSVSIYGNLTYYITDDEVTGNADEDFLTFGGGMSISF